MPPCGGAAPSGRCCDPETMADGRHLLRAPPPPGSAPPPVYPPLRYWRWNRYPELLAAYRVIWLSSGAGAPALPDRPHPRATPRASRRAGRHAPLANTRASLAPSTTCQPAPHRPPRIDKPPRVLAPRPPQRRRTTALRHHSAAVLGGYCLFVIPVTPSRSHHPTHHLIPIDLRSALRSVLRFALRLDRRVDIRFAIRFALRFSSSTHYTVLLRRRLAATSTGAPGSFCHSLVAQLSSPTRGGSNPLPYP